ncbi:hypothetical protein HPB47_027864, partial [Ixodes persulcatus]
MKSETEHQPWRRLVRPTLLPQAQAQEVQLACLKAQSLQDLQPACRQSDEIDFQACLEKQDFVTSLVWQKCVVEAAGLNVA